jgi:GxxExxY protein
MERGKLLPDDVSRSVIGIFYDVYNELGYGFLEHVHARAMDKEMRSRGHLVERETPTPILFRGDVLCAQRLDMVIDKQLVVEIKSSETLPSHAIRQLRNYLYATPFEIGLLLHFGPKPKFYRQLVTNDRKKPGIWRLPD